MTSRRRAPALVTAHGGGPGNDSVTYNVGTFYGGPGNDVVYVNGANGTFYPGPQN